MYVIRQRIARLLEAGGVLATTAQPLAAEVVALALGDAYQRAVLGIAEDSDGELFVQQRQRAVAHGLGATALDKLLESDSGNGNKTP
jgi:hypothetical protein